MTLVRRIEDKLNQLQMEAKLVQILFDTLGGNFGVAVFQLSMWKTRNSGPKDFDKLIRTFPRALPGWLVTLGSTLGCRQGTLYKAPRNAERKLQDDNVWTKSDYWNLLVCQQSTPLHVGHCAYSSTFFANLFYNFYRIQSSWETCAIELGDYVTPESGTFFTHEQGRSLTEPWRSVWFPFTVNKGPKRKQVYLFTGSKSKQSRDKDKQECAQWVAARRQFGPSWRDVCPESALSKDRSLLLSISPHTTGW